MAEIGDPRWAEADFVVVRGGSSRGTLTQARQGTLYDPAAGATAIYELAAVGQRVQRAAVSQLGRAGLGELGVDQRDVRVC